MWFKKDKKKKDDGYITAEEREEIIRQKKIEMDKKKEQNIKDFLYKTDVEIREEILEGDDICRVFLEDGGLISDKEIPIVLEPIIKKLEKAGYKVELEVKDELWEHAFGFVRFRGDLKFYKKEDDKNDFR